MNAVTLASDAVRVVVVPEAGGKIASLEHVPSGREWLLAPPRHWPEPARYGATFTGEPLWGWDEMLPTIDACDGLPDHGEVWALPWSVEAGGDGRLRCAVEGRALPYRLVRDIVVSGARVTLGYELSASEELAVLWAAHPQFTLDPEGTRVLVPPVVERLLDVTGGPAGRAALEEPLAALPRGAGRKLYVEPEVATGSITLSDRRGPWLRLAWDPVELPYLGAWIDNCALAPRPVVAIEPTNGYYDSLERAVSLGRAAEVTPARPLRWRLELELGGK